MQIELRYRGDVRRTYQVWRCLRRGHIVAGRIIGLVYLVVMVAVGVLEAWAAEAVIGVLSGLILIPLPDLALWVQARRNRAAIERDVEVRLTAADLSYRTPILRIDVPWGDVRRVVETGSFWAFVIDRQTIVGLYKDRLTPDQQAELSGFLAARRQGVPGDGPVRR